MDEEKYKKNLISVIVPIYNTESYLEECINSIINQSYKNLDIILINDGSTDKSKAICEEYTKKDPRIRLINKNNGGLSSARNCGVVNSNGDILAFVDSDDIIAPFFLETLFKALVTSDSDIACCESIKFVENDSAKLWSIWDKEDKLQSEYTVYDVKSILIESLYERLRVTETQYKIYKKKLFNDVFFPDGKIYEDLATTYKLFLNSKRIVFVHEKMYGYRKRKNSILSNKFSDINMSCIWVSELLKMELGNDECFSKAVSDAVFRINRVVYAKVPYFRKRKFRKDIWQKIKQNRRVVLGDSYAKKYERVLAGMSFGGPLFFKVVICLYERLKLLYYSMQR